MAIPMHTEAQYDFSGGVSDTKDPKLLAPNEVADSRNMSYSKGHYAYQRLGSSKLNQSGISEVKGKGIAQLIDNETQTKTLIVLGSDNKIYKYNANNSTLEEMKELSGSAYFDTVLYKNTLYLVVGSGEMQKIYNSTILACGLDRPNKPTCKVYDAGTNLKGTYEFKIVNVKEMEGKKIRSAASESSEPITVTNKGITVNVGTKPDDVEYRELYGKEGNVSVFRLIGVIEETGYAGATEVLLPNANGDNNEFSTQYPDSGNHYDKVDEEAPDDNDTYLESADGVAGQLELFNFPNTSIPGTATINWVRVYARLRANGEKFCRVAVKAGGTLDLSDLLANNTYPNYTDIEETWELNPHDSQPWEVADINAIQAGFKNKDNWKIRVTRCKIEIGYTELTGATTINVDTNEKDWLGDRLKIHGDKPPEDMVSICLRGDRLYGVKDDVLYISDLEQPESFRLYTYLPINVDDGDTGVKLMTFGTYGILFKNWNIYFIGGFPSDEPLEFDMYAFRAKAPCGTKSPRSVVDCGDFIIFLGSDKKLYKLFENGTAECISHGTREDLGRQETLLASINEEHLSKACAMYFADLSEYRLWIPTGSSTYNDIWIVYNTKKNNFACNDNIIAGAVMSAIDGNNEVCYAVEGNGDLYIYKLDDEDAYDDYGNAMTAYVVTRKYCGQSPDRRKVFRKLWSRFKAISANIRIYYRRDTVKNWTEHGSFALSSSEEDIMIKSNIHTQGRACQYKLQFSDNSHRLVLKELHFGSQIKGLIR